MNTKENSSNIKKTKITIVGAGAVGASAATFLAIKEVASEIVLIDIKEGLSEGKALDLQHSASILNFSTKIKGVTNDYKETANSDIVIVTSGLPRKPGMSREELVNINGKIVTDVVNKISEYSKNTIFIVVTNPVDTMTYLTLKISGLSKNHVIGMGGELDSSRFRYYLSEALNCNCNDIQGIVIGGHGDKTMIPLKRIATYKGIPIKNLLSEEKLNEVVNSTCNSGFTLTSLIGTSAWTAPGAAIASLAETIIKDKKLVMCVSTLLEGEYNEKNICIGVPCIIGRNGIEDIIKIDLNEEEKGLFTEASKKIREVNEKIEVKN